MGYLSVSVFESYILIFIGLIIVLVFSALSYIFTYIKYKDNTATTEIVAVLVYIISFMCTIGFLNWAVIFGILIAGLLTFKRGIHRLPERIKKRELYSVIEFALISLVVLPLLPNKNFSPADFEVISNVLTSLGVPLSLLRQLDVFNFYSMWLMVILVTGISFLGYVLVRFFGTKKGHGLTGFFGGLISSTAVTLSISAESKKNKKFVSAFVVAVVIATATSFIRIILEVAVVNSSLLGSVLIPLGLMGLVGYGVALFLYLKDGSKKSKKEISLKQPFALMPAIKFGLFFIFIIFLSKLLYILVGSTGLYIASVVSGFADVDAITLTMSSLSRMGEISNSVATISIVLAVASNTLAKAGIAWFLGEKKFAKYILVIFVLILVVGFGALVFV